MVEQKIRSFLAVQLPDLLIDEICHFVEKIRSKYVQFRFIPPQNWHLTLHFFGSITIHEIEKVVQNLPKPISKIKPFSISFKGLGGFPNDKKSSILWISLGGQIEKLTSLKQTLDEALAGMKFPIESRSFHPHITIARAAKPTICHFTDEEKNVEFKLQFQVEKIILFQIELKSGGAQYTPLVDFPFHCTN